jgi:choice-of-anchor B domain-containing protein
MSYHKLFVIAINILLLGFLAEEPLFAQGSSNVPLLGHLDQYPSADYNDCWGYTAPDGKEYALLGVETGTSIVDINNPPNLVEVAFIPSQTSIWKDIKTLGHYAYTVNETGGGLQIIDLSDLPNSATLVKSWLGFGTSHNIFIDESTSLLYAEGNSSEPVRIISLADPENPVMMSSFGIECHDIFVQDNVAYVSEGYSGSYGIYDVSTPQTPSLLARIQVPVAGYAHNAWATANSNFLMTTEETSGKTIKLWDISNLGNISITDEILAPDGLAHNAHIKGHYAYVSHYGDGLRIYDISDPYNISEVGYYDTYPGVGGGYVGAWGAFPFFNSGKILISDIETGLYVVHFAGAAQVDSLDPNPPDMLEAYSDYTTPTAINLSWQDPDSYYNGSPLSPGDFTIEIEREGVHVASVAGGTENFTDSGLNDGQEYHYIVYAKITATDSTSLASKTQWIAGGSPIPSAPWFVNIHGNDNQVNLIWKNPSRNIDGTPMDDFAGIVLYQDGNEVATFNRTEVDSGKLDSTLYVPSNPGRHRWELAAVDNEPAQNTSDLSRAMFTPSTPPFSDNFISPGQPDPNFWINDDAEVDDLGDNEPSPPYSLNLNGDPDGGDQVDLWPVDLSGLQNRGIRFSYFYQPEGNGNNPETGDSLEVFFKNDLGEWILVRAYPGTTNQPFQAEVIDLDTAPNGGGAYFHSQFQARFRSFGTVSSGSTFDDWFVDNIYLGAQAPTISISPSVLSFDSTVTGSSSTLDLEVRNFGMGALQVSDVISTNAFFSADPTSFSVNQGGSQTVAVQFDPTTAGNHYGKLLFVSNDPNADTVMVAISGIAVEPVGLDDPENLPGEFMVAQNYPNPFNPVTTIHFELPQASNVKLEIFNLLGQRVRLLLNDRMEAGRHQLQWDGLNDRGNSVTSGVYVYRFSAGDYTRTMKMILMK